ncbi:MAG: DUF3467 domain-containing protein [Acidobacteriaceae bacterium]
MITGRTATFKDIEHPTVYSNIIGIGSTPYDIALMFGEVTSSTDTTVEGTPRVKVLLSPEQASNLAMMIKTVLENFVENNGPLRVKGAVNFVLPKPAKSIQ